MLPAIATLLLLPPLCAENGDPLGRCRSVLMVRPVQFGYNAETAATNTFQHAKDNIPGSKIQESAVKEFDSYVTKLRQQGIEVQVVSDTLEPVTPDSIFPNNWISVHPNGQMVTYPMQANNRRLERSAEIVEKIKQDRSISSHLDLSCYEDYETFLEGTGSVVFDHNHKQAYACLSPRTDQQLFRKLCSYLGYEPIDFHAYDENDVPIYHTNVMLFIGEKTAVLCSDAITDPGEAKSLLTRLTDSGRAVIDISRSQMKCFCGNIFELHNTKEESILVMSDTAYHAFTAEQLRTLESNSIIIHTPLKTIETIGGGGARCMVAGIYARGAT